MRNRSTVTTAFVLLPQQADKRPGHRHPLARPRPGCAACAAAVWIGVPVRRAGHGGIQFAGTGCTEEDAKISRCSSQDPKGLLCNQKCVSSLNFVQIQPLVLRERPLGSAFVRRAEQLQK